MTQYAKAVTAALIALLVTFAGTQAQAQTNDPNADSITIRITPNIDFGVDIDSATLESGGIIDLGAVDLFVATQTVRPATVTINGNLASAGANTGQELDVSGTITGAWSFDGTPSTDATTGEVDALATYVLFSDTSLSIAPDGDDFAADNADFTGVTLRAGGAGGAQGTKFEKTGTGVTNMDDMSPTDTRHMWLFFRLPSNSSTGAANDIQITLTAVNATS